MGGKELKPEDKGISEEAREPVLAQPTDFEIVMERMAPDQNIVDQPPFSWLANDEDLFPPEFFLQEPREVCIAFLRAVGYLTNPRYSHITKSIAFSHKQVDNARRLMKTEYRDLFEYIIDQLKKRLESFPYALEYLHEYFDTYSEYFVANGSQREKKDSPKTYAAFSVTLATLHQSLKLIGLPELLPDLSAASDVEESLPAKSRTNRRFRVNKSGSLK